MSILLTIEASTPRLSIALQERSNLIDSLILDESLQHAKRITIEIQRVTARNNIDFKQIEAVAINEGPGSFTGLRVGSSIAKGLCYGLSVPLISIRGLEAYGLFYYAYLKEKREDVFVLLDARRNNYFYTHIHKGEIRQKISFKTREEINEEIDKAKNPWVIVSNEENEMNLEAKWLCEAAWDRFNRKVFENLDNYEPNYYINNYSKK